MKIAQSSLRAAIVLAVTAGLAPAHAEVRIGLAAPLTGPMSWAGAITQQSAEFAVADLDAKGGMLGQRI
jgi:branched-chain amino acid transport system substrate-binding protein